jgi:huntingtin-interacting protein 1-related protein
LLSKIDAQAADMERLREEKDQEIAILNEGMDSTIAQLSEAQQVGLHTPFQPIAL